MSKKYSRKQKVVEVLIKVKIEKEGLDSNIQKMTRYLSEVSGYYGCQWKQDGMEQQNYNTMSKLLQQRDSHYRSLRLHSLFENVSVKEHHIEDYSPSAVRKQRAKTIPPLQDIYEDIIFHPSNWVSPSLTRKQRREILKQRNSNNKNKSRTNRNNLIDENNNCENEEDGNKEEQNCTRLRTTETIADKKFSSPQTKRRNFIKHLLTPLPEDMMTRSFDEALNEEDSEEEDGLTVIRRRLKSGDNRRGCRPRSWSE